jgi:carnitine O-acetyltransferase
VDHVSPNNWLDDSLWLPLAYHTWRVPLLINSNWWLLFASDPHDALPPSYTANTSSQSSTTDSVQPNPNPSEAIKAGTQGGGEEWVQRHVVTDNEARVSYDQAVERQEVSEWQIKRAAWLTHRFASFRTRLMRYVHLQSCVLADNCQGRDSA